MQTELELRCKAHNQAMRERRRDRWAKGSAMLEFAFVLPTFLLIVFAICDFGHVFYVETTLENAVRQAGRYAITGNHEPDPNNPGQTLSRVDSIIAVAQEKALGIDISQIQISSVAGGSGSAGGPSDTVVISLTSNLKLITPVVGKFFPNGTYSFTSSVRMKNEPFPPDQAN